MGAVRRLYKLLAGFGLLGLLAVPVQADITSNLLAHWTMDQTGASTTVPDSAGTATGTRTNGNVWVNPGKVGSGAATLDADGWIPTTDLAGLAGISAFTVAAWVKLTTVAGTPSIASQGNYAAGFQNFTFMFRYAGGLAFSIAPTGADGSWSEVLGGTITVGVWTHVAGTYDGANMRVYINAGTPVAAAKTGTLFNSTLEVALGTFKVNSAPTDFCNCDLDDVRLYTRTLSQSDLQELVNLGTAAATAVRKRPLLY